MDTIHSRSLTLSLYAYVAGIWLMAFPYFGVWHDSVLYTVQALHRLTPEAWAGDLFFRYGSQDQFTVFSSIHAWLIAFVGIERAAFFLTVVGKAFWFAGLSYFVAGYLRGLPFWLGLAVLASYSPLYDGSQVFGYGEPFATGRLYAETLTLFALGLVVRGRERCGMALAATALLLHPLMAIPGLVGAVLLSRRYGRPLIFLGLVGAVLVAIAGLIGVDPFARLFARFDPVWLATIEKRVPYIFLENWSYEAFGRIALLSTLLILTHREFRGEFLGDMAARMLMLGAGCLALSWVGASVLKDVLMTQLQLWRGLWIVQIVALSLLGALSVRLWARRPIDRILLVCLWSALLLTGWTVGALAVASLALWGLLDRYAPDWRPTRLIWAAILLLPLMGVVVAIGLIHNIVLVRHHLLGRPIWLLAMCAPLLAVPLLGLLMWVGSRYRRWGPLVAGVSGLAVLVAGILNWDVRKHNQSWDDIAAAAGPIQAMIPVGSTVYWLGSAEPTWFWLRRAQYVSKQHTVGALFSRDTAMLVDYRQSRLLEQRLEGGNPYWQQPYVDPRDPGKKEDLNPGMKVAAYLCQDTVLDFLVLPENQEFDAIAHRFTFPLDDSRQDLIDCRRLRAGSGEAQG